MVTDGSARQIKAAQNQALCREVNERIKKIAETAGNMPLVCECADLDCAETVVMTLAEYERIRSSAIRFPVVVGHDYPEFENVVDENDHYAVVQKRGPAAEVTARLDPRSRARAGPRIARLTEPTPAP